MTMRWIATAAAIGALGLTVQAYGQETTPAPREPHGTTVISPPPAEKAPSERALDQPVPGRASGGAANEPGPVVNQPGGPGGAVQQILVGRELVDARQRTIGEVQRIVGNQAIIMTDQASGLGGRLVAIDVSGLGVIGTGADARVHTSMTREEIRDLPPFRER